jgi:diguanylate cyclase (GGDEF)-like protein/PAS domain S-box-containing protein
MATETDEPDTARAYEELLQFVYLAPVGVIRFAGSGAVEMINPKAAQTLVPVAAGGLLENVFEMLGAWVPDLRVRVQCSGAEPGVFFERPRVNVGHGPSARVLSLTVARIADDAFMAVVQDVTVSARQERRLFEEEQRLRAIFDRVQDYAIYTIDVEGRVVDWNRSLYRLGGWEAGDVVGKHVSIFFPPGTFDASAAGLVLTRAALRGSIEIEGERVRKDGSVYWGDAVVTALPDSEGNVNGFVVVSRDMTERKTREDELVRLATTDTLTGAFNRRFAMDRLKEAFDRFKRYKAHASVMMIDVDHFKRVNDRFGHAAGDDVLRHLVATLRATVRNADMVARWGGEEFLVLMPETGREAAQVAANRVLAAIRAAPAPSGSTTIPFTASIGLATFSDQSENVDAIVKRADMALYAAKAGGRDRAVAE